MIKKKKRTGHLVDFSVPSDHRAKMKERRKAGQIPELNHRTEKVAEYENDIDINCNWRPWNCP